MQLASFKAKNYRLALEETFFKLDEQMLADAGQKELSKFQKQGGEDPFSPAMLMGGGRSMAGCTATVVLITPQEIYCANAGDSRTVLSKAKKACDLSVDHKPNDREEKRRIEQAGGFVQEDRVNGMLALSRALGDFEYKSNNLLKPKDQAVTAYPDIKCLPIQSDCEFILLACDGIWDVKTSQQAIDYLH